MKHGARNSERVQPAVSNDSTIYHQRFSVSYEYPVVFTHGLFSPENQAFVDTLCGLVSKRRHPTFFVVDRGVADAWPKILEDISAYVHRCGDRLTLTAPVQVLEGGEAAKNDPQVVDRLQEQISALGLDRHALVVTVGGGALQDAVGYAAATAHRGLRVVRVPTTVLSQNDSGVGVKNGVNAFGAKNFLGTFTPPFAVLVDFDFLATLHPRDKKSGMAEAVKVSLVRDASFFRWLEEHVEDLASFETARVEHLVERCAKLHLEHIATSGDPFELGSARPLDFGHWAAHQLETLTKHELRHGEAVAVGVALDSCYSTEIGMLNGQARESICNLLEGLGLPLWHESLATLSPGGRPLVLDGLDEFRQHLGGELNITLLEDIGRGVEVHTIDDASVSRSIGWLRKRRDR